MTSYLAGFALMLSLIVAIGAQNLFVLRQGLRREHVGLVVAICAASDAVLTVAGVAGMGAAVNSHPILVTIIRWAGAAFLVACDLLARTILSPVEIPVGIVTAMIGGPFFLWLLVRKS